MPMKRSGTSILFVNDESRILLVLRDDKPGLPYANMWDVPGGHVEDGETPEACIVREMKEEIGIDLDDFSLFRVYDFTDRIEHVFIKYCNYKINDLHLTEGQALRWFNRSEIEKTELAYGFNQVAMDFFRIHHDPSTPR